MPDPQYYAHRIQAIVADGPLTLQQKQQALRLVKKELGMEIRAIRSGIQGARARVGTGFGAAVSRGLFGRRVAGRSNAVQRENLRAQRNNLIAPYENLAHQIDHLLIELGLPPAPPITPGAPPKKKFFLGLGLGMSAVVLLGIVLACCLMFSLAVSAGNKAPPRIVTRTEVTSTPLPPTITLTATSTLTPTITATLAPLTATRWARTQSALATQQAGDTATAARIATRTQRAADTQTSGLTVTADYQASRTARAATRVVYTPPPPTKAPYTGPVVRTGAKCADGTTSGATGTGACSRHGGVACWYLSDGSCR